MHHGAHLDMTLGPIDTTFKFDTYINFDFDWVIDTSKVSDTEYMWSKNLKITFLLIIGQYSKSWYKIIFGVT